jgi:hypothetical protein
MTTALEGGEGSASRPGFSLPLRKTRYPLYRRLGGPQGRSGQVRKILPPRGLDPWTVQRVVRRYTDYATRLTITQCAWAILFCHVCLSVWLYYIFPRFLINGMIFGRKNWLNMQCVFWYFLIFFWSISHPNKNSARFRHSFIHVFR